MKICKICKKERELQHFQKATKKYLRAECKWCTAKLNHEKYMRRKIKLVKERKA